MLHDCRWFRKPNRSHAIAIVRQVLPKNTVSLPCDSAESAHPFTRADFTREDCRTKVESSYSHQSRKFLF
jgi:hypothetical protein